MAAVLCRICLSTVPPKHSTSLFSDKGLQLKLSERLCELLCVPVSACDNLPDHICRSCRQRVESLESKLLLFRKQARESYEKLSHEPTSRKRTKNTSSAQGISPATAKSRPPAKRNTLQRRQLFSSEKENSFTG